MTLRPFVAGLLAVFIPALILGGCAHRVAPAPAFVEELSAQYHRLDLAERQAQNWYFGQYFGTKGDQVKQGIDVQPENPESWSMPREKRPYLNNAYDRLQIALVPDRKKVTSPIHAARAQAYFDCWVEQSHLRMGTGPDKVDCHAAFYREFCAMYPGKCVKPGELEGLNDHVFRVYFGSGSSSVGSHGRQVVAAAAKAYSAGGHEIILTGHADKSGSDKTNMSLSKARVVQVRTMLIDQGVPAEHIMENYFGAHQPMVKGKGADARNRRVMIVVR